jgi:hypothetical protein
MIVGVGEAMLDEWLTHVRAGSLRPIEDHVPLT